MSQRFFCETTITGATVRLAGQEAHHLAHVLRARPGEQVLVFDGSGVEFVCRVEAIGRSAADLSVVGRQEVDRESACRLVLGVALPKGDRQRWLVEKAVELGVERLVPLQTERGVAQPTEQAMGRLRRAVIEASKQCGRNRLMAIDRPQSVEEFSRVESACRLIAHPSGVVRLATVGPAVASGRPAYGAIGPEGGFTEGEVQAATAAGWTCVSLGRRILRVETAAVLLAAWAALGDVG